MVLKNIPQEVVDATVGGLTPAGAAPLISANPEVDSLKGTVGSRPQVNLRSRALVPGRHWSVCIPRPIEFEHRALDLRLT